jgi:hypothetical protein
MCTAKTRVGRQFWTCILVLIGFALLSPGVKAQENPGGATTSIWEGTTKARCNTMVTAHNRCNAVQNIKLTLVQQGSKITGSYACSYGNQNCRSMNESGKIKEGSLVDTDLRILVEMRDGSACRFTGILSGDSGKGTYSCKGGSELSERGSWRIKRQKS